MRYAYPVEVSTEPDGITITCPDVPEMVTGGWGDLAANLDAAADALTTALSFYVEDGRPIPLASPPEGRAIVCVPTLAAAKLSLHGAMLEAKVTNAELARRLGLDERVVNQLRNPSHHSDIDVVERALRALGQRLELNDVAS